MDFVSSTDDTFPAFTTFYFVFCVNCATDEFFITLCTLWIDGKEFLQVEPVEESCVYDKTMPLIEL